MAALVLGALLMGGALPAEARIVRTRSAGDGEQELVVGAAFEYARDEYALPLLIEWGITERLKLALEPGGYGAVRDDDGELVQGFRESDAAAIWELREADDDRIGVALELAVKLPTETNEELGNGEYDFTLGLVLGREIGSGDLELNLSYTRVGDPPDEQLDNVLEASLAGEWRVAQRVDFIAEIAVASGGGGRDSGFGGGFDGSQGSGTEGELTLGLAQRLTRHLKIEQGVTFDSGGEWQLLLAFEWQRGDDD